ncbi:serine/threonine protein kinase-related protein [Deinococcus marmoris]|uniref:Serine/threonine protein kinase-related protein n=1 Tax=Deinococcus marmoris TaxID=249408 RepID=A0A1U7NRJ2_9DEIO|nr:serine/threonine protein kinase-related protein [Deinococcus marmoris]
MPVLTPQQQAIVAAGVARADGGQIYLPLAASAGALGLSVSSVTPRTANLMVDGALLPVAVRAFNNVPFVLLSALAGLPGTAARLVLAPAPAVTLTRAEQDITFPIRLAQLVPLREKPEFPGVLPK